MKQQLGQFFTTNSDYILQGLEIFIKDKEVVDPFAGNGDLLRWATKNGCRLAKGFDIDKKYTDGKIINYNDSLNNPQAYCFVLTNPPYLHKNKADKKTKDRFFSGEHSKFEDLYQVSTFSILGSEEGILVVPLNFLSAENSTKIRELFFAKFDIVKLNIFSERVFEDTTYNVIAFYYKKKSYLCDKNKFVATIFPECKKAQFVLEKEFTWRLGGRFFERVKEAKNNLNIFRLTEDFLKQGKEKAVIAVQDLKNKQTIMVNKEIKRKIANNILFLRAIDSKNGSKIQLEDIRHYDIFGLAGKSTSRNLAHLIFGNDLSVGEQKTLMAMFNKELNENREKYCSLFLTNFRDNNRKRISFDFTYKFLNYLYTKAYEKQPTLF